MKHSNKYLLIVISIILLMILFLISHLFLKSQNNTTSILENSEGVLVDDLSQGEGTIVNGKFSSHEKNISEKDMKEAEKSIAQEAEEIDNLLKHSVVDKNDIPVNTHSPTNHSDNQLMSIPEDIEEKDLVEVGDTPINVSEDVEIIDIPEIFLGE